jgi:predicted nucleotidyltransferase
VHSLALFRSTARGQAEVGSDVDTLISFVSAPTSKQYFGARFYLGKVCISSNPSLRAQRSNPFLLTNQGLMDRRVAALLAMTDLFRPSLEDVLQCPVDLVTEKALRQELRPYVERDAGHV